MKKIVIISILLILSFVGCEERPYTKIYNKDEIGKSLKVVSLTSKNKNFTILIENELKNYDISIDNKSPFNIEFIYAYYKKRCNNPLASSRAKSYNGFVRFSLFKDKKRVYICQKDFNGEIDKDLIEELLEVMMDDMNLWN